MRGRAGFLTLSAGRTRSREAQQLKEMFSRFGFQLGFTLLGTWNDGTQEAHKLRRINTNEVDQVVKTLAAN